MTAAPLPAPMPAPMPAPLAARPSSVLARRAGLALVWLVVLLMAMDAAMKLLRVPQAVQGTVALGFPESSLLWIGLAQLVSLALIVVPRTRPLGALILTAYFGGAVATNVRMHGPLFTHVLSAVYVAVVLWAGIWLSDARIRALLLAPAR